MPSPNLWVMQVSVGFIVNKPRLLSAIIMDMSVDRYATKQGFRGGAKLTSVFAKVFHKISGCCKSEKIVLRIVTSSSDNISKQVGTTSRRLFLNLKDTVRIFLFDLTAN